MIEVHQTERTEAAAQATEFWQWVLNLLDCGGHELMSDEEDLTVLDESNPSRLLMIAAKQVLVVEWRHTYFEKLLTFIDVTTGIEELIFGRTGRPSFRRIPGQKVSSWPPPTGLPKSFFKPIYLTKLNTIEKAALVIDETEFVLRSFEGYLDD
ncbi:hypothetical protein F5050DRAFT_1699888, partial [Lentinula boryana]